MTGQEEKTMDLTFDQIIQLAENPSANLLYLLSVDPRKDPPSPDIPLMAGRKKVILTGEFWTGEVEYRVTFPGGVQGRMRYAHVRSDNPGNLTPEFVNFTKCLVASGVVTAALALFYHSPNEKTSQAIVSAILTAGTACLIANPITPFEFTRNVINASFGTRWGGWG